MVAFSGLPREILLHIEWCEQYLDFPWAPEPSDYDLLLAQELLEAWEDGCSVEEIQSIWRRKKP